MGLAPAIDAKRNQAKRAIALKVPRVETAWPEFYGFFIVNGNRP
jgi:hypothetical protein